MSSHKAIILAAGKSRRMGDLTAGTPKCLLSLGDKTILEHQIENLRLCGITDITIVTGFCENMIKQSLNTSVNYILNKDFATTNSIYSLWLALREIKGDIVILNSDVVFHPGILKNLLLSANPDALAVSFRSEMGEEEMKVQVKDGKVIDISKKMDMNIADGENVGIVKFSAPGVEILYSMVEKLIGDGVVNAWAPLAFQKICSFHNLYAISTSGLPWTEIDFPEDLESARIQVYPKIQKDMTKTFP